MVRKIVDYGIKLAGISFILTVVWQVLEYFLEGKVEPSKTDTIIGGLFVYSLNSNLKSFENRGAK